MFFWGSETCKEKDARKSINSIDVVKFLQFEETVDGNLVQCRHKSMNEVLNKFFLIKIVISLSMKMQSMFVSQHGGTIEKGHSLSYSLCA